MAAIKNMFLEIHYELFKVIFIQAFLDAALVFLALLLVLNIFGFGILLPFLLTVVFFVVDGFLRWKKLNLKRIEDENPDVSEMLRTAADNKEDDSLMAHALFADVIERMREVSGGTFIDFKQVGVKIGVMFMLSLVLVSLAYFNVNIQKFENPLAGMGDKLAGLGSLFGAPTHIRGGNLSDADDDLFGEPRIANLGDQELDVTVQQSLSQIDFTQVSDAQPSSDVPDDYPVDVSAEASEAYTAGLADINDRKAASDYSQEINK